MGARDFANLDNDDAMDFLGDFLDAPEGAGDDDEPGKLAMLVGVLAIAAQAIEDETDPDDEEDDDEDQDDDESDSYLESPDACFALAAAEVIAAIHGKPARELTKPSNAEADTNGRVAAWIASAGSREKTLTDPKMLMLAKQAVTRVRNDSELSELWGDADPKAARAWLAGIDELLKRLD